MTPQSFIASVVVALVLGVCGIIAVQHKMLSDAREQLTNVRRELVTTKLSIEELERDARQTAERKTLTETTRDAIISSPATQDSGAAPVLVYGLRQADLIGGGE